MPAGLVPAGISQGLEHKLGTRTGNDGNQPAITGIWGSPFNRSSHKGTVALCLP
jgi:hypothetical protein